MKTIIWPEELEKELGTTRRGLYNRIQRGMLPKPLRISGKICWRRADWEKWLENEAQKQGVAVQVVEEPHQTFRRRGPGRPPGSKNKKAEGRRA